MTKGKVDLNKATKTPKFTKELVNYKRVLMGTPLKLESICAGEPLPKIKWTHTLNKPKPITSSISKIPGTEKDPQEMISSVISIDNVKAENAGKYSCEITNIAGRANTFCYIDVVKDEKVFKSYERAKK